MFFSNFRSWPLAVALAGTLAAYTASITPDRKATLDRISVQSLQGHLWFLSSDLLEGRDTPSRGLDLAAAYIASQFRRAGLKPAGDDANIPRKTYFYHFGEALWAVPDWDRKVPIPITLRWKDVPSGWKISNSYGSGDHRQEVRDSIERFI